MFEDNTPLINDHPEQRDQLVENSVVFGTSAEEVVKEIRFRIEQKTQLTASAGIQARMNNNNVLCFHNICCSNLREHYLGDQHCHSIVLQRNMQSLPRLRLSDVRGVRVTPGFCLVFLC